MPSLLIHLAASNEYLKKHSKEIKDAKAFRKGSVSPDLDKNLENILSREGKIFSHYYIEDDGHIDFEKFLHDPAVNMSSDFWKGYYLHLLTDEFFYMNNFREEYIRSCTENVYLYTDYQNLGKWLIKKYHIGKSENFFTKRILFLSQPTSGKTQYIKKRKLKKFVKKMSKIDLKKAR